MEQIDFVTAGGHRLEYRWIPGERGRPVLVFLHQGLGSVSMWRDFPDVLAARTGCPALIYSRYGHGRSDVVAEPRRPDFMVVEGREVLPEILAALGVKDTILVGHSDGATIALNCLVTGAGTARAAIVVAPHVLDEETIRRSVEELREGWGREELRERLARHHRDADRTFLSWAQVWLLPGMRGWTMEPELRAIHCPVLAIQGVEDTLGTMIHIDTIARVSGGPVQIEKLEDCGHDPFRERPERMIALCTEFVGRFSAPHTRRRGAGSTP